MSNNDQSADAIRADIERTRERLGGTVEALGAHLNPSLLKQRVKDSVREATIGRAKTMARNARDKAEESGRGLIGTLRDNPIPAAMIAGGIGWLLFGKRRERDAENVADWDYHNSVGASEDASTTTPYREAPTIDYSHQLPEHAASDRGVGSRAREASERVVSGARHAGESVVSGARSAGETVASTARAAGEKVASGTSRVAHTIADRARAGGHKVEETFEQNPMMLGVVAAAVGLAVGMSLPATEKESQLMGSKRDELIDKARDTISDTKEKVRHVAERAVPEVRDTLKDVAREEGLAG
jgi:ElaB/YqjD/DUF883 family membrane-anchored ribosome-binding protein